MVKGWKGEQQKQGVYVFPDMGHSSQDAGLLLQQAKRDMIWGPKNIQKTADDKMGGQECPQESIPQEFPQDPPQEGPQKGRGTNASGPQEGPQKGQG